MPVLWERSQLNSHPMSLDDPRSWPSNCGHYGSLLRLQFVALLGVVAAILALPSNGLGMNICWSRFIFHVSCPGCGVTRSMIAFAHGNFRESFLFHPAGHLIFIYLILVLFQRGSSLFGLPEYLGVIRRTSFGTVILSLAVTGWVVKSLLM